MLRLTTSVMAICNTLELICVGDYDQEPNAWLSINEDVW
jgi:hypothetical protein